MYPIILHLHALTAVITISLFVIRFLGLQKSAKFMQYKWLRYIPHLNDTCLFIFGITLIILTQQYPFTTKSLWLTEKLGFLVAYILLGYVAIKGLAFRASIRYGAFGLALLCFMMIVFLVKTKTAL